MFNGVQQHHTRTTTSHAEDSLQYVPPRRLLGTPATLEILVANILEDINCPLPDALRQLLNEEKKLPLNTAGALLPALMDRADVHERADNEVWSQILLCFTEARTSDKSSFVFLTGTSGVGKSK